MIDELNKKIEAGEPASVFRAIQPTFLWETVVGYLTHCADNNIGEPISILAYKLPYAEQIDSITPVKEYLSENINKEILDRKSTRLNSSHIPLSRMPSSA